MGRTKWYGAGLVLGAGVLVAAVAVAPALARVKESRDAKPAAPAPAAADAGARRWTSSTQFMEIRAGRIGNGRVYLTVRPAKKRILGESFETVPVPGPYAEVAVIPNARILHLDGESGTPEAFVTDLARRDNPVEAFDITFDAQGKVTQIDWLYVP